MKVALTFTALGFAAVSAMALSSVASVSPPPRQAPPVVGPGKPFVDDLSSLDQAIWSVSDGWSNGAYMVNDWRKAQTRFGKGLVLALEDRPGGISRYASGEVQSRDTFGHGYYEATMQAASGSGIISGFFTYTGPPFGKPWNEIDVEILGKNTRDATLSYYYNGKSLSHVVALDFDAASGLHHYAFDWQPDYIRWYIDGRLVLRSSGIRATTSKRFSKDHDAPLGEPTASRSGQGHSTHAQFQPACDLDALHIHTVGPRPTNVAAGRVSRDCGSIHSAAQHPRDW
ncbi:MAG: family 16 glycosylhydrolase [Sphingopyxis sp.]|nr:family 16 glycosylhydrolase [Sphingopyxis sp.]